MGCFSLALSLMQALQKKSSRTSHCPVLVKKSFFGRSLFASRKIAKNIEKNGVLKAPVIA